MNIKKYILPLLILLMSYSVNGQQNPHYTQYMYNMSIINPAYVGVRSDLSIGLLGRSQWVGVEGAPETLTFSAGARVFDGIGIGLSAVQDKIGLLEDTTVNLDLSYTLVTSQYSRLSLGIKGGFTNFTNNLSQGITPGNETYENLTGTYTNFGIGAFYHNEKFYVGLSMPQLFETPKFILEDNFSAGLNKNMTYLTTFGAVFELNENIKFRPSSLIKVTSGLPVSVDINANFLLKDRLEIGTSYRYNDSVSGMVALILNESFRLGYAYDHTLTDLVNFNSGSHEIMLLLDLNFSKRSRWLTNSSCYF